MTDLISKTPPTFTFKWAKLETYPTWTQSTHTFDTPSAAADRAAEWLAIAFENGFKIQIALVQLDSGTES